jgi:heptosyltransferase-2
MRCLIATYAWLLARLPEAFARLNAWVLGWMIWILRGPLIKRNLREAFPQRDGQWVRRIGKLSCQRTAEMGLYAIASPLLPEAEIRERILPHPSMVEGDSAIPHGRPVVLFVPHFSLMEMMTAVRIVHPTLAAREWVTLYRPLDVAAAEIWVKESRERFGMKLVSRRDGFGQVMRAVREGGIGCILFDQNTSSGTKIDFLGHPCSVTDLPGIIAQRFHASSHIFWAERQGFWRCQLRTHTLQSRDSMGLTLESNAWLAERLSSSDEACADWLWAHDRWRHSQKN